MNTKMLHITKNIKGSRSFEDYRSATWKKGSSSDVNIINAKKIEKEPKKDDGTPVVKNFFNFDNSIGHEGDAVVYEEAEERLFQTNVEPDEMTAAKEKAGEATQLNNIRASHNCWDDLLKKERDDQTNQNPKQCRISTSTLSANGKLDNLSERQSDQVTTIRDESDKNIANICKHTEKNVSLKLVLGNSVVSRNCVSVNSKLGVLAYPASGTAVIMDIINYRQLCYFRQSKQPISCVSFSLDGSMLLVGEFGRRPALSVWSLQHSNCIYTPQESAGRQGTLRFDRYLVAKLLGHERGIKCAAFSPAKDIIVSVGVVHDGLINVWSWPGKRIIASNRFAENITAMSFSTMAQHLVTCGVHHLKFWDLGDRRLERDPPRRRTLHGRSAILGSFKENSFIDVAFGTKRSADYVYTIVAKGLICQLTNKRAVTLYKKIRAKRFSSMQVDDDRLIISSTSWEVLFFNALTFQFQKIIALPIDACLAEQLLGCNSVNTPLNGRNTPFLRRRRRSFLALDSERNLLTATADSGILCIWDISDMENIKKNYYWAGHSSAISCMDSMMLGPRANEISTYTSSHDGTIHRYNIRTSKNEISCESRRIIYNFPGSRDSSKSDKVNKERHTDLTHRKFLPAKKESMKITAIKVCSQQLHLVSGSSRGELTIYSLDDLRKVKTLRVHTREITAIDLLMNTVKKFELLVSGSRDRSICIVSLAHGLRLLNKLNIHSGSICGLSLCSTPTGLTLFSSASDRTLVVCRSPLSKHLHFKANHCYVNVSSVIELKVSQHHIVVGKHNGSISIIDSTSLDNIHEFRACQNSAARLEKLCVYSCGGILITACSDHSLNIFTLPTGTLLSSVKGHARRVSGLQVDLPLKHVLSTSIDGCIFAWSVSSRIRQVANRKKRLESSPR